MASLEMEGGSDAPGKDDNATLVDILGLPPRNGSPESVDHTTTLAGILGFPPRNRSKKRLRKKMTKEKVRESYVSQGNAPGKDDNATLAENLGLPPRNGSPESVDDTTTLAEILGFPPRNRSKKRRRKKMTKEKVRESYVSQGNAISSVLGKTNVEKKRDPCVPDSRASNGTGCLDVEIPRVFSAPEEKGKKRSSLQWCFKTGDIVWAKAFPYTWWPGWICRIKVSEASISFFGCKKTKWFQVSEIYEFEENFAHMSKLVCVKLSDEINLALEELSRRVALGLMCSCRNYAVEANDISDDRIAEVKRGFDPKGMFGFVLDMAVSAWVGDTETAGAVRVSAQVLAYRHYVQICQTSEVDERFDPAEILDSVRDMAVCLSVNDEETAVVAKTVAQLNAYRGFVSVHPEWVYLQTVELRDSSLSDESEGSHQEISDSSSESEIVFGVMGEPEEDVLAEAREEEDELQEQMKEGRDTCVINRADFSIVDLDKEYNSVSDNQLEAVANWSGSEVSDNCSNQNLEVQNLCTASSQESEIEVACNKSFSHVRDVNQTAANESGFHINAENVDSLSCHDANYMLKNIDPQVTNLVVQSGKDLSLSRISEKTSETDKLKQEDADITTVEHEHNYSLLETSLSLGGQLHKYLASKCDMCSPDEMSKFDVNFQSSAEVSIVVNAEDANESGSMNIISSISSPIRKVWENGSKKWRHDQPFASNKSKLHKTLAPYSEIIADASPMMNNLCSICDKILYNDEVIAADKVNEKALLLANVDEDVMKLHSSNKDGIISYISKRKADNMKASCSSTLPKCVSRSTFHGKKGHDQHVNSDLFKWCKLYSSPLIRDGSKLTIKARGPSVTDRFSSFPKSLHMKFPKDFPLPSKEELEKKFRMFGPLLHSKTKIFFYTGAGQVVFLNQADADAAYEYVKRKNVFGPANIRFWFDEHENFRKGTRDIFAMGQSSLNLKSCLKRSNALPDRDETKKCRVRFLP